jgi:hypothetical protein
MNDRKDTRDEGPKKHEAQSRTIFDTPDAVRFLNAIEELIFEIRKLNQNLAARRNP